MTSAQKVIKYLAIAFAMFLIVSIISMILAGLFALSGILGLKKRIETPTTSEMVTTSFENSEITILDIELTFTNLTIKTGDTLKVETDNSYISSKQENQKLKIEEKNNSWLRNQKERNLILYLPENIELEKVQIDTAAGRIDIESLNTENLSFDLGAGETEIQKLNVSENCKINGGAGKVSILDGTINDLDLDMGVGEINLTASLIGRNEINAGVGNLNVDLLGEKDSYKIQADKGIGSVKIDGKEIADGKIFGDGENHIQVDGGIGNIDIDFKDSMSIVGVENL